MLFAQWRFWVNCVCECQRLTPHWATVWTILGLLFAHWLSASCVTTTQTSGTPLDQQLPAMSTVYGRPSPLTQILLQLKVHVCLSVWRICLAVCLATQWRPLCTEMDVVSCLTVLLFANVVIHVQSSVMACRSVQSLAQTLHYSPF